MLLSTYCHHETRTDSNMNTNQVKHWWKNSTTPGSGDEVVTSPPLNRKVGCSRPSMIRARCLRVKQHYPAQKNNQKKLHVVLKQGHNSGSPWWAVQLLCWSFPQWINGLKSIPMIEFWILHSTQSIDEIRENIFGLLIMFTLCKNRTQKRKRACQNENYVVLQED